jgi:predicted molibdopterin-dependent oxidoreductase YjgC
MIEMKIIIDGKEIECQPDQKVLDVAKANGIHIPTLCFNPLNSEKRPAGCRLCLVEVKAGGRPGLQSSCSLPVSEGLSVSTCSDVVFNERREVVELLLSEHEQDCRNCPISGECNFAKLCRDYDINGVPVCAECPNQKEGCLLARGVLCLGPITYGNCDAYCTRRGMRCEGCHSVLVNEDVLKFGLKAYAKAGFTKQEILDAAKVYSFEGVKILEKVMKEEGFK